MGHPVMEYLTSSQDSRRLKVKSLDQASIRTVVEIKKFLKRFLVGCCVGLQRARVQWIEHLDELLYCSSFRNIKTTHNGDGDSGSGDNLLKEKTIPTVVIHPTIRNPEDSVKGKRLIFES